MRMIVSAISINLGGEKFSLTPEQAIRLRDELNSAIQNPVHTLFGFNVVEVNTELHNNCLAVVFIQGEKGMEPAVLMVKV